MLPINYLLLASLDDEMNGYREKMKLTARQSQIITSIAELTKTLKTHPGNVIQPFFQRLTKQPHLEEFLDGVNILLTRLSSARLSKRLKRKRLDVRRNKHQICTIFPKKNAWDRDVWLRWKSLKRYQTMVDAFESRNVDQLHDALAQMDPEEAEYHTKRCINSGLWVANS